MPRATDLGDRVAAEVREALDLLHAAGRQGIRVPEGVVASVFSAKEEERQGKPVDAAGRTRLWTACSVLRDLVGPAVSARRWHRFWFYLALSALLVTQCYFTVGAVTRDQIKRLDQELFVLQGQLTAVAGKALLARELQEQAAQRSASGPSIEDQLNVRGADRDAYQALAGRLMFFLPTVSEDGAGPGSEADRKADLAVARSLRLTTLSLTLDFLAKYVLPALYGLLGACAFVLRQLSDELGNLRFAHESRVQYELRLHVGLISGLAIGWFVNPGDNGSMVTSLSPLALAFVAGYGSDLLFALLDRVVGAFVTPQTEIRAKKIEEGVGELERGSEPKTGIRVGEGRSGDSDHKEAA